VIITDQRKNVHNPSIKGSLFITIEEKAKESLASPLFRHYSSTRLIPE